MTQKLIKCYNFADEPNIRSKLTFSDATKIRLNPVTGKLELKQISTQRATGKPVYSTDANLFLTIAETNPLSLFQWLGFAVAPRPSQQPTGASVGFKLNDGTDDRYWDGAAWSVAGLSDWNTVQLITANISTFPATSQKLSIIINLLTTDKLVTPQVASIDLLMVCRLQYLDSLVARSLIPSLREGIRPTIEIAAHATGSTKFNLGRLEENPNIVSVSAVYDKTSDPNRLTNLLSSYDTLAKKVTLSSAPTRGNELRIEFVVEPEVYLNFSSQDYTEVSKIPAVILDSFRVTGNEVYALFAVEDINNDTAVVRKVPFRLALEFTVLLLGKGNRVLLRMMDQAMSHATNNPTLTWRDLDEEVTLRMVDEGNFSPRPNLADIHQTQYTLRFEDVFLWLRPEETLNIVKTLNLTLLSPELQGGPRWTGIK